MIEKFEKFLLGIYEEGYSSCEKLSDRYELLL